MPRRVKYAQASRSRWPGSLCRRGYPAPGGRGPGRRPKSPRHARRDCRGGFAPGHSGRLRGGPGGCPCGDRCEPRPLRATDAADERIKAHQDPAAPPGRPVLAVQQDGHIQPVVLFNEVTRRSCPSGTGRVLTSPAKPLSLTNGFSLPAGVSTATPLARQATGSPSGSLTEAEPSNGWLLNSRSRPPRREVAPVAASMSSTGNSPPHAVPSRAAGAKY